MGGRGVGWTTPRPGRFTSRKDTVPTVTEAGCAAETFSTCAENLLPHHDSIHGPSSWSRVSIYRLCHLGPPLTPTLTLIHTWFQRKRSSSADLFSTKVISRHKNDAPNYLVKAKNSIKRGQPSTLQYRLNNRQDC
jgi:hypothetical protein